MKRLLKLLILALLFRAANPEEQTVLVGATAEMSPAESDSTAVENLISKTWMSGLYADYVG